MRRFSRSAVDAELAQTFDESVSSTLPAVTLLLALLYGAYALGHYLLLPLPDAWVMASAAGLSALVLIGVRAVLRMWPVPPRWAHPAAALVAALVLANGLLHLRITARPIESTNLLLLILGSGLVFLSSRWLVLVIAATLLGWAAVRWSLPPSPEWGHYGFALAAGTVLAVIVHVARRRMAERLMLLRRHDARTQAQLEAALRSAARELEERKQAERALRASESRYRLVAEGTRDLLWTMDPEGRFTYMSPSMERLLGFPPELAIGRRIEESALTADSAAQASKLLARARAGELEEVIFEAEMRTRSGATVWCETSAVVTRDGQGRVESIQAVSRDITERRRAEELLRLTQFAVDHAGDSIFWIGPDGGILHVNETACRTLGYGRQELESLSITDIHPYYGREEWSRFWQLLRKQSRVSFESHQRSKAGVVFPVEVVVNLVEYEGQERAFAFVRDISERREAEQSLRESERRFRATFHQTALGMAIVDRNGRYLEVNRSFCEMLGYQEQELLERTVFDLTPPEDRAALRERTRAALRGEVQAVVVEKRYLRKDGSSVWARTTRQGVSVDSDEPRFFLSVIEDISDRRRAQQELRRAKEAAETADRAKSEFLAMMSHEIRTPMNAVIGMTQLLADTPLSPEQREYLETIRTSGDALLGIINDLLDLSKIEAGRLELEQIDFDLRRLVEDVADLFAEQASRKGLEILSWVEASTPVALRGDPVRLRQMLVNLVSNAVKFTRHGEVFVRAGARGIAAGSAAIHVEVSDSGIGIPEGDRDRIFEPFSQVDASTTRHYGGTGLGLAICARLVRQMGGTIGVESEPGRGSRFWFEVPLRLQPGAATAASPERELQGRRVLVIDDHEASRALLVERLAAWGIRCAQASDRRSAEQALGAGAGSFDAVIVDARLMQGEAGIGIAHAVRSAGSPMLLLASRTPRPLAASVDDVVRVRLTKPVRDAGLRQALGALVTGRDPAPAPEPVTDERSRWGPRLRVLLAEDHPVNRKLTVRMLQKLGHDVEVVANGRDAVAAVARGRFGAVLMDCRMPELDGFEATARIRALDRERAGHQPIIAMTADAMPEDRERCLAAGMDDYLSKPVRLEELRAALERCGDAAQPDAAPAPVAEAALLERLDGDAELLADLVQLFLDESQDQLARIEDALARGDAPELGAAAHALKGAAANLEAGATVEAAQALEAIGRRGDLARAAELCRMLATELARLRPALLDLSQRHRA